MPSEEFILRGQTASGETEILNFSGYSPGYAYRMTEFQLYPSSGIGNTSVELCAAITAAKTSESPDNPNFGNEGLIGTAMYSASNPSGIEPRPTYSVVNDLFLITQDLIISVIDTVGGAPTAVNWQCRFEKVKLSSAAEAVANFKQFTIYDG